MRILVTGASGVIGSRLVPALVRRGDTVVATTRTPEKLATLRELGAQPAVLDGLDATAVRELVVAVRPAAIVHQMTALSGPLDMRRFDRSFARTNALRTTGTENLINAAADAGTRQLVVQGYTGWTNARTDGPVVPEELGYDPSPAPAQRETQAALQRMEAMVLEAPLDGAVLRYANLYGPRASDQYLSLLRKRLLPIIGGGAGVWSWLHVDDAASATVAAIDRSARGVFNVADDDPAPVAEWLPGLAEAVDAPPPMRVPAWLGRLLAGDVAVRWMTEGRGASNARIRADLGWRPIWLTWREGFRGLAAPAPAATRRLAR